MVELRPFRAIRYHTSSANELDDLVAPPYDLISPKERANLRRRSEHNMVHVILPRSHRKAKILADAWLGRGVWKQDPRDSLFLLRQRFRVGNQWQERLGLIGLIRMEAPESGLILPHEQTLSQPKKDRLELLRKTHMNFDCIFSIAEDSDHQLQKILQRSRPHKPIAKATTPDGVTHELYEISQTLPLQKMIGLLQKKKLLIADGHHRYEAARLFQQERTEGRLPFPNDPANFVLMYIAPSSSPSGRRGLSVLPFHRLVEGIPVERLAEFDSTAEEYFQIERLPFTKKTETQVRQSLLQKLEQGAQVGATFGLVLAKRDEYLLLRLRKRAPILKLIPDGHTATWKKLDVSILHGLIFHSILGLSKESFSDQAHLTYVKSIEDAFKEMQSGKFQMLFLLNPTPIDQIFEIARKSEVLPQKSTYFYPKIPTGLVMRRLV